MDGFSSNGLKYTGLDFIEEGRRNIFEWGEKRRSKRTGVRGRIYEITKLFIDRSIIRSFINNLSIVVGFQMLLAGFCTYACVQLNLEFDVQMSLFVSPIVFPLAFSINANYQRRETVLEDLAMFKAASLILFFCHRDWIKATSLPVDLLKTLSNKLKFLVINIREYLLTEESKKRQFILQAVYEDFSDISQLNDKLRASELRSNSSLIARIIHCHNLMCWSFEKLRVIREYKSPRSLRSFTKVFIFFMPLLLSPYYVYRGTQTQSYWAPYYISALVSFLFGSLQAVQDKLDDPFDGIGEDDVNLGQLDDWTMQSLLTNRTVTVGRFTVTTTAPPGHQEDDSGRTSPLRTCFNQQEEPIVLNIISSPKKSRRRSSVRNKRDSIVPEKVLNDEEFSNELEARCHGISSKLEGLSGSTTILPGNRTALFVEKQKLSSGSEKDSNDSGGGGDKMGKPRSVLPQESGLEVVKESDETGDVSTDISPVSQSYDMRLENKSNRFIKKKPDFLSVFANDTDTVTSEDSVSGESSHVKSEERPKMYSMQPEIPDGSTTDEYEPFDNIVPKIQTEKSAMGLFGINKNSENSSKKKTEEEKKPEKLSLLFANDSAAEQGGDVRPHSPLTSAEEDFSEDNYDGAITERLHNPRPTLRSAPESEQNNIPNLKFSLPARKRQQWSMPGRLSKWRKRRPKKRSSSQGTDKKDDARSDANVINTSTTSTAFLLSDAGTGAEGRDNEGNEFAVDNSRTLQRFEEKQSEVKRTESKKDMEDNKDEIKTLLTNPVQASDNDERTTKKPSRFAVSNSKT